MMRSSYCCARGGAGGSVSGKSSMSSAKNTTKRNRFIFQQNHVLFKRRRYDDDRSTLNAGGWFQNNKDVDGRDETFKRQQEILAKRRKGGRIDEEANKRRAKVSGFMKKTLSKKEMEEIKTENTKAANAFGWFLRLFPDWFARRHAAFVTPLILPWLVSDAEVNDVPLEARARESCEESKVPANAFEAVFAGTKSQQEGYKQGVLVKRCRVLEESGCVSVCKNVCKIPTETFFTEKVGLPVTLIPNYETLECQFCYGRVADGTEGEEAGGCYVGCLASGTKSCGVDNNSGSDSSNESGSKL